MYALFEEAGKFLAGRILSEAEPRRKSSWTAANGSRSRPPTSCSSSRNRRPPSCWRRRRPWRETIELELAWEFAPEDEFGFADLARDYFSADATLAQQAGALLRLFEAPHYFRRAGKGRFKKAPPEILQQALAAIEKKKVILAQIADWAAELAAGRCPAPIREQLYKILFKPGQERARIQGRGRGQPRHAHCAAGAAAAGRRHRLALPVPLAALFVRQLPQRHGVSRRCRRRQSPKTCRWPMCRPTRSTTRNTTEIDDALSVQGLGTGTVVLGIHIAAPGLAVLPGSAIDQVGRNRLSTVYMPGYKITMLPDEVVQGYTLDEGRANPAVSLYVTIDEATLEIPPQKPSSSACRSAANLRHDQLDHIVTEEWLRPDD
jgi:exoribonuclease-2